MTEKLEDVEKYFENSKCKICGVVVNHIFRAIPNSQKRNIWLKSIRI